MTKREFTSVYIQYHAQRERACRSFVCRTSTGRGWRRTWWNCRLWLRFTLRAGRRRRTRSSASKRGLWEQLCCGHCIQHVHTHTARYLDSSWSTKLMCRAGEASCRASGAAQDPQWAGEGATEASWGAEVANWATNLYIYSWGRPSCSFFHHLPLGWANS